MRSMTEPFIRRDKDAPTAPTNGMTTRYGRLSILSKGTGPSMKYDPRSNRKDAAPGNQTFLACKSMAAPLSSHVSVGRAPCLSLTGRSAQHRDQLRGPRQLWPADLVSCISLLCGPSRARRLLSPERCDIPKRLLPERACRSCAQTREAGQAEAVTACPQDIG